MNLNSSIIAAELDNLVLRKHIVSDFKTCTISHIGLIKKDEELRDDAIYLVRGADIDMIEGATGKAFVLFAYIGQSWSPGLDANDIILIRPDIETDELFMAVQEIFAKYSAWDSRLREIVTRGGALGDLVKASMSIFGCNIMLHDREFRIISYEMPSREQAGNTFATLGDGDFFSKEQIEVVRVFSHKNYGFTDPFTIRMPHFSEYSDHGRDLSYNVMLPDDYVVRINLTSAERDRGIPDYQYPLIETLGQYVRFSYMLYPAVSAPTRSSRISACLQQIINGEIVDREELEAAAKTRGWDYFNDLYICMGVIPMDERGQRATLPSSALISIANRLSCVSKEIVAINDGKMVYLFVNITKDKPSNEQGLTMYRQAAIENNLLIIEATSCEGMRHLKSRYEQVKAISDYAADTHPSPGFVRIESMTLGFIYHALKQCIDPIAIVPEPLITLIHHDNVNSSCLSETLRAYLECNCSPVAAAKQLYIERSTFYYRLNRANEILQMDLDDADVRLQLLIAFKILDRETQRTIEML